MKKREKEAKERCWEHDDYMYMYWLKEKEHDIMSGKRWKRENSISSLPGIWV